MLFIKLSDEELLHYSDELVWVRPDEGVVSAIDDDELRTKHAVPERLRAVYWYRDHSSRQ